MSRRVMVATLDWGLGHATRCIPIIRELLDKKCEVVIAGSGPSLELLRTEFPDLPFAELPGYAVRYSSTASQVMTIAAQLPRLARVIRSERKATEKIVAHHGVSIVISDNRYGCYASATINVFMGHQVNLIMPSGTRRLSSIVNRLHAGMTAKFDYWWVPDFQGTESLAGALSASGNSRLRYIGPLSRFEGIEETTKEYDLAFLLSGPEPQRTLLEQWVLKVAPTTAMKIALVRGTSMGMDRVTTPNLSTFNLLGSDDVGRIIAASEVVVARSGYSTIMDLFHAGGKAVFVPTPGQTEQEYLACRMAELGYAGYVEQSKIDLASIVETANAYRGFTGRVRDRSHLRRALDELLTI
ncbi:MAG TPA: glycosyltransferase [Cyclobacteriaceae bacterium]